MSLPTYVDFMHPILVLLNQSREGLRSSELYPLLADQFKLSTEDMSERLKSGMLTYQNRILWAVEYLKKSAFLSKPNRGHYIITDEGRRFLQQHSHGFGLKDLPKEVVSITTSDVPDLLLTHPEKIESQTPEDRIESAIAEIRNRVESDLRERLQSSGWSFFEHVVLDLLASMGFAEGGLKHNGGSGDEGIDGIAYTDKLKLGKIYVQAKRWKAAVGRPQIQEFYGALDGQRAQQGVYFTTSRFTQEAIQYAGNASKQSYLLMELP